MGNQNPALFSDAPAPDDSHLFSDEPAPESQGKLESGAYGALRNLPLGNQVTALSAPINPFTEKSNYSDEMSYLTKKEDQAHEQNKKSYNVGSALGTLGPLAIPFLGTAGKAAGAAMKAYPLASDAVIGALQSQSDTNLTQKPTYKNIADAGRGALLGLGTGAVFNKIGKAFPSKAVSQEAEGLAAPVTEELASPAAKVGAGDVANAAVAAAKPADIIPPQPAGRTPGGILPDATPVSADFVPSADRIAASNWARSIGFTPRKFSTFATELGENPQAAAIEGQKWSEEKGLIKWMDHPGEALARIGPIKKDVGEFIGNMVDKFGTEPIPAEEMKAELQNLAKRTANPSSRGALTNVADRIDEMAKDGVLDWHAINELKSMIGQEVGEHPNISKAYGLMSQRMEMMAEATGKRIGDPSLLEKYQGAKRDYRMASLLEPALRYSESKNLIGGPAGHNTLRGVLGQLTEAFTGAPPIDQIAKNVVAKSAPLVKGVANAGDSARKATGALTKSLPNMSDAERLELSNALQTYFNKKKP